VGQVGLFCPSSKSHKSKLAQLESVIAQELCQVRRRDNLAAGFHMLVEALFWFHPLVWWMGVRLIEERERACDEEVLSLGADPHVYAEGIRIFANSIWSRRSRAPPASPAPISRKESKPS